MNTTRKEFLLIFLEIVRCISDKPYQERIWVKGLGPEVADFDDTACEFFSSVDTILDDSKNFGLTKSQHQQLLEFKTEFKFFCDGPAIEFYMPFNFIDRPEWDHIIKLAQHLLTDLEINEITPRMVLEF